MTVMFAVALWLAVEAAAIAVMLADRRRAPRKQDPLPKEAETMRANDGSDIRFICLVKGAERYIFLYSDTPEKRIEVLRTMGRFASNPDLSFTWYDAARLSQLVRNGETAAVGTRTLGKH